MTRTGGRGLVITVTPPAGPLGLAAGGLAMTGLGRAGAGRMLGPVGLGTGRNTGLMAGGFAKIGFGAGRTDGEGRGEGAGRSTGPEGPGAGLSTGWLPSRS